MISNFLPVLVINLLLLVAVIVPAFNVTLSPEASPNVVLPVTLRAPVTVNVLPSNVKLASPLIELASENVAILLLTPLAPSTKLEPQTRESISSVLSSLLAVLITTELSVPVPMLGTTMSLSAFNSISPSA